MSTSDRLTNKWELSRTMSKRTGTRHLTYFVVLMSCPQSVIINTEPDKHKRWSQCRPSPAAIIITKHFPLPRHVQPGNVTYSSWRYQKQSYRYLRYTVLKKSLRTIFLRHITQNFDFDHKKVMIHGHESIGQALVMPLGYWRITFLSVIDTKRPKVSSRHECHEKKIVSCFPFSNMSYRIQLLSRQSEESFFRRSPRKRRKELSSHWIESPLLQLTLTKSKESPVINTWKTVTSNW